MVRQVQQSSLFEAIPKTFFHRGRGVTSQRKEGRDMQSSLERVKGEQWASIQDLTITASPQLAKLDDNLAFTVGFKLKVASGAISSDPSGRRPMTSMTSDSEWPTE